MRYVNLLLALWVVSTAACAAEKHLHPDLSVRGHMHDPCVQFESETEAWKTCRLEYGYGTLLGKVNAGEGTQNEIMMARQTADALAVVYTSESMALAQGSADLGHMARRRSLDACRIEKGEGHPECVALATHSYRLSPAGAPPPPVATASVASPAGIRLVVGGFTLDQIQWAGPKPANWEVDVDRRRRTIAVSVGGVVRGHLDGDDSNFVSGSCYEFKQSPNGEVVIELCPTGTIPAGP